MKNKAKSQKSDFTAADYKRLNRLAKSQKKSKALKVTPEYIDSLNK